MINWPDGKKFAFTIVDDTDNSFVSNVAPVYELLHECNMKTTKTVWVYPPRDKFTGGCLLDPDYREFVKDVNKKGFEIALHNVGSGPFSRNEIEEGIEIFKDIMGYYPKMQINHASNPDNIFWGIERYTFFLKYLMKIVYGQRRIYCGTNQASDYFWGDISKKHIRFIRNHTFNGINTLEYDPGMPYRVKSKDDYSNYWFSSSDAHTVDEFNNLVTRRNVQELEAQGGLCIVYTHFASGFLDQTGELDSCFVENIKYLSGRNGWFAPAGEILDYLISVQDPGDEYVSNIYLILLDVKWIFDRIYKKLRYGR